jgi:hypothetical protein
MAAKIHRGALQDRPVGMSAQRDALNPRLLSPQPSSWRRPSEEGAAMSRHDGRDLEAGHEPSEAGVGFKRLLNETARAR